MPGRSLVFFIISKSKIQQEVYMAKRAVAEDLKLDVTIWFELPESTLDLRSRKPFKTVKTEYS